MKHFIYSALIFACFLVACNSNKTKDSETTEEAKTENSTTETSTTDNTATNSADDVQKKMDELKKLPALSNEQLKAMLPEELAGMKRKSSFVSSNLGYGVGQAAYKSDDGKEMRLTVYDCVGEAGAGWYNMMFWGWNMEQEDENGYQKTTTFNGNKAIEKYEKNRDQYTLMYAANNRILVSLEGEKTGLDSVKQAAGSLNLKTN
jgi:hypothetical protein